MKSMCHDPRRSSPSVADWRPTSSCIRTTDADGVVLDGPELLGGEAAGGGVLAGLAAATRGGAGCRRDRPGTVVSR